MPLLFFRYRYSRVGDRWRLKTKGNFLIRNGRHHSRQVDFLSSWSGIIIKMALNWMVLSFGIPFSNAMLQFCYYNFCVNEIWWIAIFFLNNGTIIVRIWSKWMQICDAFHMMHPIRYVIGKIVHIEKPLIIHFHKYYTQGIMD